MDVTAPVPTEEELNKLLCRTFTSDMRKGYVTVNNFLMPEQYFAYQKNLKEFEVFDTDIWICGFTKTGTTWMSEIAWLIANNFDYDGAKIPDHKRSRLVEFSMLLDLSGQKRFAHDEFAIDSFTFAKTQPHPRTIKSHLPFSLLPDQIVNGSKKPMIIYTARNPMDTCVSYYHHCFTFEGFRGTFEEFCQLFLYDKVTYAPYSAHVLSFWEHRSDPNVLFTTYEEMKKDLPGVIQKVAKLLNKTVSEKDSKQLEEHVSFDSMKQNPAVNKENYINEAEKNRGVKLQQFIRAGKVGGYRDRMSSEMIEQFRYLMKKRFDGSGLNLLD